MSTEIQEKQIINVAEINPPIVELESYEQKQLRLLEENPFVEIIDNATYELAKKARTNLVKGRTEIEKQDKSIASLLTIFRKKISDVKDSLVKITLEAEEKQQNEVKRWEAIKEAERQEKARLEEERKQKIKDSISATFNRWNNSLQSLQFSEIENFKKLYTESIGEIDITQFEEFEIDFIERKGLFEMQLQAKIKDLQEREAQRVENERIRKENEEKERQLAEERKRLAEQERALKEESERLKAEQDKREAEIKAKEDEIRRQQEQVEAERRAKEEAEAKAFAEEQAHEEIKQVYVSIGKTAPLNLDSDKEKAEKCLKSAWIKVESFPEFSDIHFKSQFIKAVNEINMLIDNEIKRLNNL